MFLVVVAAVGAVFFVMAAVLRRWWVLLVPMSLWAAQLVLTALTRGLGDSENTPESVLLFWAIVGLAPVLVMTALGVVAGKTIERVRERRRHSSVP